MNFKYLFVFLLLLFSACSDDSLVKEIYHFRSTSVQDEICIVKNGAEKEKCEQFDEELNMFLELVIDQRDRVWLSGIKRAGEESRLILGTKDLSGGFLFIEETIDKNEETNCVLTRRLTLSLRSNQEISDINAEIDKCAALLGREILEVRSSSACDENKEDPAQYTRYVRKRWQADKNCGPE